jgi:hypothetical protein
MIKHKDNQFCGNCMYFKPRAWNQDRLPFIGSCRRYAPKPLYGARPEYVQDLDDADDCGCSIYNKNRPANVWAYFPEIEIDYGKDETAWCGEWKPRAKWQEEVDKEWDEIYEKRRAEMGTTSGKTTRH